MVKAYTGRKEVKKNNSGGDLNVPYVTIYLLYLLSVANGGLRELHFVCGTEPFRASL